MEQKNRIEILDGFRCISILMVLLYHFYTRWKVPNTHAAYDTFPRYFKYGYFGVQFFFMISGFVIFYTLEKSSSPGNFLLKRFIRLFPPILLCSLITFFFVPLADPGYTFPSFHSKTPLNLLPSITFIHPYFWNKLLQADNIYYVNGSYWSLWVEVCFYGMAGLLFFYNKEMFVSNWVKLLFPLTFLRVIGSPVYNFQFSNPQISFIAGIIKKSVVYLTICDFMAYFTLGIIFYCLYFRKKVSKINIVICSLFVLYEFYYLQVAGLQFIFLFIIILFLLFIYKTEYLRFLNLRIISRIGLVSYTLYLIHENVGIILINNLSSLTTSRFITVCIPVFVILLFIAFAELSYRFYERPFSKKLTDLFIKKKAGINNTATKQQ